ncbi:MAG: hypothetical protein NW226_18265 [Microscillaceae bacterium]|nr:hypothetical protein [Microscillaceae bacterium]
MILDKDNMDQSEEIPEYSDTMELVRWWEKHRIHFNILVGLSGILGLWVYRTYNLIYYYPEILLEMVIYGILANICYTMGWALEILRITYKIPFPPLDRFKEVLFYGGVFFSVAFTFLMAFLLTWI